MSMIGCFYALKDDDLNAIFENPKRIKKLWGAPEPVSNPSLLSKLFGAKAPLKEESDSWMPSEKAESFDVDKAWQGIHFLLTGSDWEGDGLAAFILHGGREIDEDLGYGPPHGFNSTEVKEIVQTLDQLNLEELYAKADPKTFAANEIYPSIWDSEPKEQSIGYVMDNLKSLKEFLGKAAQSNRALIVYLG
jgi:Domain of unknown function (DUF1877)